MADLPEPSSSRKLLKVGNTSVDTRLIGFGVLLFVVTRFVVWLPLGFVGTWINGLLWPVLIVSILTGAGLRYLKSRRSRQTSR
ncbi:MAG: hypothetical protein ACR2P0_02150 [Acidimicrobiales bacterium]